MLSSLHLVFNASALVACLARTGDHDAIVLIGDGVYGSNLYPELICLSDDARARGVDVQNSISYAEFVELCTQHHPVVSWHES